MINKIFEEIEKLSQSLDLKDELTEDVYHYTLLANSFDIFRTRTLFMEDYKHIHGEFKHPLKCLKQRVPEKPFAYNVVYQETILSKFWESLEWYMDHKIRSYRMSFCLDRDSRHMWQNFLKRDDNRVALRFSKEYFKLSTTPVLSLNNGQVDPILVRTRISYEDGKQKEDGLAKLAVLINKLLGKLTKENQDEILVGLYQYIIALSPKFLTSETNLHPEREYRCYAFYDHLLNSDSKESIVNLPNNGNGKQGIYTREIPCEFIKEILVLSSSDFPKRKEEIKQFFKKEFPNGEFDHIEITESNISKANI